MIAPDKLYVSHLIYDTWQYTTPDPDDETEVEYVRKDALLEWAGMRQECQNLHLEYDAGVYDCLQCLIDKLNLM